MSKVKGCWILITNEVRGHEVLNTHYKRCQRSKGIKHSLQTIFPETMIHHDHLGGDSFSGEEERQSNNKRYDKWHRLTFLLSQVRQETTQKLKTCNSHIDNCKQRNSLFFKQWDMFCVCVCVEITEKIQLQHSKYPWLF